MNYTQMINKEKAFFSFLTQLTRKNELTIHYYGMIISKTKRRYDCSYIGYETNTEGYFGIHYDLIKNHYYFGTINKNRPSTLTALTYPQIDEIPQFLKTILINVATSRRKVSIRKSEVKDEKI